MASPLPSLPPLPRPPAFSTRPLTGEAVTPLDLAVLHDLPSLELQARFMMDGFLNGLHRSPQKGFSVEFAEYRDYQLGDDLRRVDWRLYGRSDRLHVKQFEQETQLRVFLVLDISASMGFASKPETWLRKVDFARTLLAAMGLLAMRQGDAFGLALIGDGLTEFVKPKASPAHWRRTLGHLDGLRCGGPTGLARGLETLSDLLPRRSMVVIASDFYDESEAIQSVLRRFRFDHHEVIALQTLDPGEINLDEDQNGSFVDMETGEKLILDAAAVKKGYTERFNRFLDETKTSFVDSGGDYELVRTDQSPMSSLGLYLARRENLF